MAIPIIVWLGGVVGGLWWLASPSGPKIPDNLPDWRAGAQAAQKEGRGYEIRLSDYEAIDAAHFAKDEPPLLLLPPIGTIIPNELLGGDNDPIPGAPNYRWKDTGNRLDGVVPPIWRPIAAQSARILEVIRAAAGTDVKLTSWWRGPRASKSTDQGEYDRRGGWGGYHPVGAAMDIYVPAWVGDGKDKARVSEAKQKLYDLIEALIRAGKIPDGGLGIYGDKYKIVHYDPRTILLPNHKRGRRSRWDRRPDPITGKVDLSGG